MGRHKTVSINQSGKDEMRSAIIIGATSGIGRALAEQLAAEGVRLGLTGRREAPLEELKAILPTEVNTACFDVSEPTARQQLMGLIAEMGDVDLVIISAGTGFIDPDLPWEKEHETLATNGLGFAAMAHGAFEYFVKAGKGHLVGITSIAAIRGGEAVAYNASKALAASYLQGLRIRALKAGLPIQITDIQPGFVDTKMAQGEGLFWVAPPETAARQILAAVKRGAPHAYITKRWRLIAWFLKMVPDRLFARLG
jgi:short-subunit dehydrogenase